MEGLEEGYHRIEVRTRGAVHTLVVGLVVLPLEGLGLPRGQEGALLASVPLLRLSGLLGALAWELL